MTGSWIRGMLVTCAATSAGCAPLTFSEEGAIDFERYSRVEVAVESNATTDGWATRYLVEELRASSGFAQVDAVPSPSADLFLDVPCSSEPATTTGTRPTRPSRRSKHGMRRAA
jgi:hypothetical protein